MAKKKKKRKLKVKNLIILIIVICGIFFTFKNGINFFKNSFNKIEEKIDNSPILNNKKNEEKKLLENYNNCLNKKYDESELSDELSTKISDVYNFINSNYNASVYYEDITSGFSFKFRENEIYYGASLIKIVEAMYLFDKAESNEIDINDTIKYTSKYISDFSTGMKTRKIGEEVSIKDLISYAIMYSDNSAHFMLSDYIGISNLREYGKSLGAKNILSGGDSFGNQSANDTNIYLHHAYEIINSGSEYGKLLKEYMLNTDHNSLYLTEKENNNVAHKYGSYSTFYHDIGIVYEEYPYYISILTNAKKNSFNDSIGMSIPVNDIHKKINELHHLFYEERQTSCHLEVYGS